MGYEGSGGELGVGATLLYQKGKGLQVGVMEVKEEERHEKDSLNLQGRAKFAEQLFEKRD